MKPSVAKTELGQKNGQSRPIDKIGSIAQMIAAYDSRLVAELRRGPRAGVGSVAYWGLLAKYEIPISREEQWADVLQSIAVLTPKGKPHGKRESAYDPQLPMGQALYSAKISESRLARLLAAPKEIRGGSVVRLCRRLAASGHNQFDLSTLAKFILGWKSASETIAREYYRADDTSVPGPTKI